MESGWIDKQPPTVSITISVGGFLSWILLKPLSIVEKTKHEARLNDMIKGDHVFMLSL